jgi:tetratricopeptide (TPR) repeat protein/transcriptional regulator with XRE-family HTH domain
VAEVSVVAFGGLLRQLRTDAGLTQEELAEAARISTRAVSDLERGVSLTARKETARLLAGALGLAGLAREEFEAVARGRVSEGRTLVSGGAGATRTLPRDIVLFTGRQGELRQLVDLGESGGVVGIHAIGGMAGVGKTAFAVHAAHQLAPRFPDGQLFLPLHGHTPGQQPVRPAEALASLLLSAGVAAQQIPPGLEARMGLWRHHLTDRKLLLLLDDAVDSEQVRPLLPAAPGSLILITSRRHLVALEDARCISLDTLPPGEAALLFVRLAARNGLDSGDPAVQEVTRLCAYLPLAVGLTARQLHHHPAWTAADLAADLATARDRLELMAAENLSVAAAFDLSYQELPEQQQRTFRRLGLHPGADIDSYAVAALDDTGLGAARRNLQSLYDRYLLTEPTRGRYRLHDLIREHARALAYADPVADRHTAMGRLLDYYLHTARAASRHLTRRIPIAAPRLSGGSPQHSPDLSAREDAIKWMDAERLNLQAATGYAALRDFARGYAIAIPAALEGFLRIQGQWDQALTLHQMALQAARQSSDRLSEAGVLADLGTAKRLLGDHSAATTDLQLAFELSSQLGNRRGEANALQQLGLIQYLSGDYPAAADSLTVALEHFRDLCDALGEANTLNDLGAVHALTCDYPAATDRLRRALSLYESLDDQHGQAAVLNHLGAVQRLAGDYLASAASEMQAIELHSMMGNDFGRATALDDLGVVQFLTGDYAAAIASHTQALELFRSVGHRVGQGSALNNLGASQRLTGEYSIAIANHTQALELFHNVGFRYGEAAALSDLGAVQVLVDDYSAATASFGQALEIYIGLRNRHGEAEVLNNMGEAALTLSATRDAQSHHEKALAIAINIAAPAEEARALEGIGRCQLLNSEISQGAASLHRSLAIYERINSPNAQRVATLLRDQQL